MKKEFIITRQGKDFVLYEGLLDEAHQQGLSRISTTVIQIPDDGNGHTAVVRAEAETSKGTFSGIGDASPGNVNRMIVPHLLRMAETRAKARALRDATNIGVTAVEELSDFDGEGSNDPDMATSEPNGANGGGYRTDFPKASPYKPASANQIATAMKLTNLLGQDEEAWDDMTSAEISERITDLSREYNERKGTTRRSAASGEAERRYSEQDIADAMEANPEAARQADQLRERAERAAKASKQKAPVDLEQKRQERPGEATLEQLVGKLAQMKGTSEKTELERVQRMIRAESLYTGSDEIKQRGRTWLLTEIGKEERKTKGA